MILPTKPRVAVCIGAFEHGGQGTVVEQELIHLQDRFELTLVAERITKPVPDGVSAVEVSAWRTLPATNPALIDLLRRFDLVHCHDSLGMMLAALAARRRFVVTSHGIAPVWLRSTARSAVEGLVTLVAYPRLYRSADVVVAISRYVANWLKTFAGIEAHLIPNGVTDVIAANPSQPLTRRLLYVGEISRRKGIGDLIEGLKSTPRDVTLHLVGGGRTAPFIAYADRLQLADRIQFDGFLELAALSNAYASAFCVCSASLWEGFGLPILEGFSFGRPAIVRAQGGMLELVQEASAGCHFQQATEFAGCIEAVTQNWEELSERARAFARLHPWSEVFRAYGELFRNLI
jgi:glycosyltransferase involved in cell wall biosynthesis